MVDEFGNERFIEMCDGCGSVQSVRAPDVYWDGEPEHGLANDPSTGQARVFGSKGEKAAYLREHNLTEAGDRERGGFKSYGGPRSVDRKLNREIVRKSLAEVKSWGQEFRKEAFLKIKKESEGWR